MSTVAITLSKFTSTGYDDEVFNADCSPIGWWVTLKSGAQLFTADQVLQLVADILSGPGRNQFKIVTKHSHGGETHQYLLNDTPPFNTDRKREGRIKVILQCLQRSIERKVPDLHETPANIG